MKVAAFLALTALGVMAAPANAAPCLTVSEAEAVTQVALPDIVLEAGRVCVNTLPPTSLVRRTSGPFLAKYQTAANRAWPAARSALIKLADPDFAPLLGSDFARPLLTSMLVPQLLGRVAPADCPTIDRLVTQLEPLPAANTASIVVTTLQYLNAEKAKGNRLVADVPDLPICARTRR